MAFEIIKLTYLLWHTVIVAATAAAPVLWALPLTSAVTFDRWVCYLWHCVYVACRVLWQLSMHTRILLRALLSTSMATSLPLPLTRFVIQSWVTAQLHLNYTCCQ